MCEIIKIDIEKCTGCNRCIRVCPVEEANVAYTEAGKARVRVDKDKCIACGFCQKACHHGSRLYDDDTERFFEDLRSGVPISVLVAPAARANLEQWGRVLTLLRQMGVRHIYDVSLGADICIWGYIRHIQKNNPQSIISQPCPAIVDYILMHKHELIPYLSPVHSPMLCIAIYMKQYQGVNDRIAAISPCIAKRNEFEQTGGLVEYNVTFAKLEDYIKRNNIQLPAQESGFDHVDSGLGCVFPMPGGLKANIEFMLGKALRVDTKEGQHAVYKALDAFIMEDAADLPAVFDVLNCAEGCNLGTGCRHDKTFFQVSRAMEKARQHAVEGRDRAYFEQRYAEYDNILRLEDFMRDYRPIQVQSISIDERDIENAFEQMGKFVSESRAFDCCACGSDTCRDMAVKIAKKLNTPENCMEKVHGELSKMANHDVLTGLPNRQYLMNYLPDIAKKALGNQLSFALLLIDLDNFKAVNDSAGHDAGDELLRSVAAYLESACEDVKSFRPPPGILDVSVRIGGDEFVRIIPGVSTEEEAHMVAKKLLDDFALSDPDSAQCGFRRTLGHYIKNHQVGMSVGLALFPNHTKDYSVLIKYADIAMYYAKKHGKNAYKIYSSELNQGDTEKHDSGGLEQRRYRARTE